ALFWGLAAAAGGGLDDAAALDGAATLLRGASPPYDVMDIFAALKPRVRGEASPGDHPGAELLYTARIAVRAAVEPGTDVIEALGEDAARHDGAALHALAAVLRRDALKKQVSGGDAPRAERGDDPPTPDGVSFRLARPARPTEGAAEPTLEPSAEPEEHTGDGPSLLGALRRVLGRRAATPPAVVGRLSELSLVDLLQTLTLGGRTARVLVLGGAERGVVQVRDGRLVAATHGPRVGEVALHSLVATRDGRFEVRFEDDGTGNLTGASEFLLLEAVRRRDEQRAR
ncbi:MAG: DUF4388 domain-containing protein, partial [Myxococcota bacterium]